MSLSHNFLEQESIGKLLWKFSLPAVVGMIVNALYNVVDRIYIGHIEKVGHLAITGVGVIFPVMLLSFAFALLVGLGSSANISLHLGKKERDRAEQFLGNSLVLGSIFSLVFMILIFLVMKKVIYFVGGSDLSYPYAKQYLEIVAIGFLPTTLSYILNSAIRSDGNPKMAMLTLLIGTFVNVILDPIFIFTLHMGVRGAALATVLSQIVSFLWTIYYFTSSKIVMKLKKKNIRLHCDLSKKVIALGSSSFGVQVGVSAINYIMNVILRQYGGDLSIGAMAIIQSIMSLLLMPIFGINQGVQPILGYNYGARRYDRVKEALFKGIGAASVICIVGFLSIELFSQYWIVLFTKEESLLQLAEYGLRRQVLVFPIVGFQIVSSIYFQAVGKPKLSFLISMSRQILVLIPCLFFLSSIWGLNGVWYASPLSDFIATIVTFILIKRELKHLEYLKSEKEREETLK